MKIITVVGARPQFIKASVVSKAILEHSNIQEIIIHTGQHFDANMSDFFFEDLKIPKPKYNLNIDSGSHGAMTGRMLEEIEKILLIEKPDAVMVYGDTNSTLAGALAASKLHIKVVHVEAGLRSFNMKMPEEINRILTDRISNILFCSTDKAIENLSSEGFENYKDTSIHNIGDVMKDSAFLFEKISQKPSEINFDEFFLCTFHRAENTDDKNRLSEIVEALNTIHKEIMPVVLPLHPRTKKMLAEHKLDLNIKLIDPVSYLEMIWLIKNSKAVLTDSGGLQKEAYFFNRPCITMRDETEWVELIDVGANILTGANKNNIMKAARTYKDMVFDNSQFYGDGKASQKIVKIFEALN